MAHLTLSFLGEFRAELDGKPLTNFRSERVKGLLAYLALEGDRPHRRTALAARFWPDELEQTAKQNLRQSLYQLRQCLGELSQPAAQATSFLLITRDTVQLNPVSAYTLDVTTFLSHIRCQAWEQAVVLYRGELLAGLTCESEPFELWLYSKREDYQNKALKALDTLTKQMLAQAEFANAHTYAQRQLALAPWREEAHRQLMMALARSGEWGAALAQFETCRRVLQAELAVEPDAQTVALYEQIRRGRLNKETKLSSPPAPSRTVRLPACLLHDAVSQGASAIFVERTRELAELTKALTAARNGRGQIRFVIGEAGRGKTALVRAVIRQVQVDQADLLVIGGACNAYTGIGDPYLPFREALALLAGDVETRWANDFLPSTHARRLWSAQPIVLPALIEQAPDLIGPFVSGKSLLERAQVFALAGTPWLEQLALLASREQNGLEEKRLFTHYTAALNAVASHYPLLLILEDLHWVDTASISLLFHLSRSLGHSRICIIGTYRPDEMVTERGAQQHPLSGIVGELKRQHGDIWLDLDMLTPARGRQFVDAYLDAQPNQLDEAFRVALFQHTEGHALFTVELVRALQEGGELYQDGHDRWLAATVIPWQRLPVSVEGVIEQRIGRLSAELQAVLTVASVEGEQFIAEVVARALHAEEHSLVQCLSRELDRQYHLVTAQALEQLGGQRLSHYCFRHHLFQSYLYRQLDDMERAYWHDAVGTALELVYTGQTEPVAIQLARHFEQAGRLEKAIDYLLQAAKQAYWLSAYQEVTAHLTKGLALLATLADSPQRAWQELDLQTMLGNVLMATQGHGASALAQVFLRARELCEQLERIDLLGPIFHGLALFHSVRGEYRRADDLAQTLLNLAQQQADTELFLAAYADWGLNSLFLGELLISRAAFDQALAFHTANKRRTSTFRFGMDPYMASLGFSAATLWLLGYPDQALQRSQQAVALTKELGHPFGLAFALTWKANLSLFRGEDEQLQAAVEELTRLVDEYSFPVWAAAAKGYAGWQLVISGKVADGLARLSEGFSAWLATEQYIAQTYYLSWLIKTYMLLPDRQAASECMSQAFVLATENDERFWEAELHRLQGELLQWQDAPTADVEFCFVQAIDVARHQQAKSLELRATISLCRLWQSQGKQVEAQPLLASIYGWFTEGFATADLRDAKALLENLETEGGCA